MISSVDIVMFDIEDDKSSPADLKIFDTEDSNASDRMIVATTLKR
jgi:hypothetical protein